jgi:gamma-glutamylcyclotransferase (GGCT)/AIG2-like uncharacterized protein YtfP
MSETITKVFVYGTLKPGGRYHYIAQNAGLKAQQEAYLEGFDLYHLEPENYPALIEGTRRVFGWTFEFKNLAVGLAALDELEGVHLPIPEYRRVQVLSYTLETQLNSEVVWVYLHNNLERLKTAAWLVESGIWQPSDGLGELPQGISSSKI